MEDSPETIVALATPPGEGGVAMIRMSGPLSPQILKQLFQRKSSLKNWDSHRLYYGSLVEGNGVLLDEGLAVWMKAPHSFTGEEVVEFHIHGGPLIARKILKAICNLGARSAQAGEFSQRAFLNGKMDLTQAEAIADMIAAHSEQALKLAQAQWQGELSKPVLKLKNDLLEALVHLEAAIDFPEEEIDPEPPPALVQLMESSIGQINQWLSDYEMGRMIREGLVVVLIGKPNVGKSSLLNQLVKEDAAIVHEQPGTTRDAIEKNIQLGGVSVRLVDTAGIREAKETIEQEGIARSHRWLDRADLVLALFDLSTPLQKEDYEIASLASKKNSLFILNKTDLSPQWREEALVSYCSRPPLRISSKTGHCVGDLEKYIPQLFGIKSWENTQYAWINQLRHKEALESGRASLTASLNGLLQKHSPEFVAAGILAAAHYLGEIMGEMTHENILENIFGRFCIGK